MAPPPLVSVACALRCAAPDVAALPQISLSVSSFLDVSVRLSLKKAAASGSIRLFRRVLMRLQESTPPIDEFLMVDYLSESMDAASKHGYLDIVQQIHSIHPGTLDTAPLANAAENGDIAMVQWILENRRSDWSCVPCLDERDPEIEILEDPPRCCLRVTYEDALAANQFAVIKWLLEHGYHGPTNCLRHAGDRAAGIGDLDTVKWLHELDLSQSFTFEAIDDASRAGYTDVVAFLLMNRPEGCTRWALQYATIGGHDEILELLQSPTHRHLCCGGPPTRKQWILAYAEAGRFDLVLRELQSAELLFESLDTLLAHACSQGSLDVVKVLVGFGVKTLWLQRAAVCGHLHILEWAHEQGLGGFDAHVLIMAAMFGRLEIVQWFHQHYSGVFTVAVMDTAAKEGHLELIKWLHFNRTDGCSQDAMDGAANAGHLELVQWLHEHRTEGCTARAMDRAAQNGRHDVVKWLHFNRTEGCTTKAMDDAAANGDLELVIWLHQHRSEGCTTAAMDRAAMNGYSDVIRWLHEHRTEGCTTAAMDSAATRGDLELVIWLHEHRTEGCTARAMDNSPLYAAKWLHFNRTEGCTTAAMDKAAREGDLAKLQFLHKYRTEGCTSQAAVNATKEGHLYILQWLHRHHPQNFDLARVTDSAREVTHIRSWLESIQ